MFGSDSGFWWGVAALSFFVGLGVARAEGSTQTTRVDFEDALIKGQTHRGAIHLMERKDAQLGSLIKQRRNYRKEILAPCVMSTPCSMAQEKVEVPKKKALPVTKKSVQEVEVAPKELPVDPQSSPAPEKAVVSAKQEQPNKS